MDALILDALQDAVALCWIERHVLKVGEIREELSPYGHHLERSTAVLQCLDQPVNLLRAEDLGRGGNIVVIDPECAVVQQEEIDVVEFESSGHSCAREVGQSL